MGPELIAVVFFGAFAGGIVNGLTGFGTGLTTLGLWLYILEPTAAATLVIICSIVSQMQTLRMIWHAIVWRRVLTFLIPGVLGVPLGAYILPHIDPNYFRIGVGAFLIAYSVYVLTRKEMLKSAWGGRVADGVVGFAGGILGGIAGLSGALPVVWADVRGWTKEERRSFVQIFNIAILFLALASHALAGLLTRQIWIAALFALPGTIGGARLGAFIYRRLADHAYQRIIMVLLLLSGAMLIWTSR